jgi:hypothetical protein
MWHDGSEVGKKKIVFVFSICMSDVTVLMPQQTERDCVRPTVIFSGVRLFQLLQLTSLHVWTKWKPSSGNKVIKLS